MLFEEVINKGLTSKQTAHLSKDSSCKHAVIDDEYFTETSSDHPPDPLDTLSKSRFHVQVHWQCETECGQSVGHQQQDLEVATDSSE